MPQLEEVPGGRGVLVKVLQVGLDGTDKELYLGEYGAAPDGCEFLVIGHESFGLWRNSAARSSRSGQT
jgi:threonine dehydrogenase-like Zn-dependent dehydrogenase